MCDFAETISILKDIALFVAASIASVTAIKGWYAWRRDLVVKDDREAARDLLRPTYNIRDAIAVCRSCLISSQEFPGGHRPLTGEKEGWIYFFENRLKPVLKSHQKFYLAATEAEILWGAQMRKKTDKLHACVHQLRGAISDYLESGEYDQSAHPGLPSSLRSTVFSVFGGGGDGKDKFAEQVEKAIAEIEAQVRPYLEATQSNSRNQI